MKFKNRLVFPLSRLTFVFLGMIFLSEANADSLSEQLKIDSVRKGKTSLRGVRATQRLNVGFNDLIRTLTDYDRFSEFMPNVENSKIVKKNDESIWVETKLDFGLFDVSYVLAMESIIDQDEGRASINWKRVSGDLRDIQGSWNLLRLADGTAVEYISYIDPGRMIPGWIQNMLTKGAVPELFAAISDRSKSIAENTSELAKEKKL